MSSAASAPIYDDLMRFKPEGMSPNAWAIKAGVSRTVWSDIRRHGNPSRRTLQKLLDAAGSSLAEFEALRTAGGLARTVEPALADPRSFPWRLPQPPPLPLLATAMAGEWGNGRRGIELTELRGGQLVDQVPRPVSLAADAAAYAITIVGDSMWPRFRPGRRVAVSPSAPVAIGDDVLVKLRAGLRLETSAESTPVLIKELVRRSGSAVELRQFNPDATFELPIGDIGAIEKIVGELV
jgi:SOS-response transcriptional repressor LexA